MMSMWLLQMAMNGLSQSFSPTPGARRRLRWAARASPRLIVSDLIASGVDSADIAAHLGSAGNRRFARSDDLGRVRTTDPHEDDSRGDDPSLAAGTPVPQADGRESIRGPESRPRAVPPRIR